MKTRLLTLCVALVLFVIPARADLCAKAGSFSTGTATGNLSVSTTGCTGKVLLLWTSSPGDAAQGNANLSFSFGAAVSSTERRAVWMGSKNSTDPSQAASYSTENRVLVIKNGLNPPTVVGDMDFVSFGAEQFTVNRTDAMTSDTTVFYYVLGGSELAAVKLVTFTQPAATGNFDTASVGFQPDFLMLFSTAATALDTNTSDAQFALGVTDGTSAGFFAVHEQHNQTSSNTNRYMRSAAGQLELWARNAATDSAIQRDSWVAWLSNGFRLNAVETTASATQIFALAIKGGQHNVGTISLPGTTGNVSKTGLAFQPDGLFILSNNSSAQETQDTPSTTAIGLVGAATGTSERGAAWTRSQDGRAPNDQKVNNQSTTRIWLHFSASLGVDGDADFVGFNTDGFTLNELTTSTSARLLPYWVVGPASATSTPRRRVIVVN